MSPPPNPHPRTPQPCPGQSQQYHNPLAAHPSDLPLGRSAESSTSSSGVRLSSTPSATSTLSLQRADLPSPAPPSALPELAPAPDTVTDTAAYHARITEPFEKLLSIPGVHKGHVGPPKIADRAKGFDWGENPVFPLTPFPFSVLVGGGRRTRDCSISLAGFRC